MSMSDVKRLVRMRRLAETGAARAMREAAGLSLSEAGAGAKVDRTTIHRWEHGSRRPNGDAALRYLALLEEMSQ
jgi:DNA-binding transcriptional regulator YiaG